MDKDTPVYNIENLEVDEKYRIDPFLAGLPYKNYPEAKWDLSGLFCYDDDFFNFFDSFSIAHQNLFGKDVHISKVVESVHGLNNIIWNGGRSMLETRSRSRAGERAMVSALGVEMNNPFSPTPLLYEKYNSYNVNVFFTVTNPMITEEHLNDESSNYVLSMLGDIDHDGNGIIVSSDALSDYVRSKYPNLKQKASIVKITVEKPNHKDRDFKYYKSLADRFDRVMVHPDDNFNKPLLEKMAEDPHKYELLVNEMCSLFCPVRDEHYYFYARTTLQPRKGNFIIKDPNLPSAFPEKICGRVNYFNPDPSKRTNIRSTQLNVEEVKTLYDMGFRHFKLQGRALGASFDSMYEHLAHYIFY